MIPKCIHYCWFGNGGKNELIKKCMASWKKHLPDYKFIEWNEQNFDINSVKYVKDAYENRKWAYVTDYVRLWAIYNMEVYILILM
jgi:mannosyltransferase OCH1-like enzyme